MTEENRMMWSGIAIIALLVFIVVGGLAFKWYKAGVQQDVYRRQGCEMSQWEVFIGSKPIDRNVVLPK